MKTVDKEVDCSGRCETPAGAAGQVRPHRRYSAQSPKTIITGEIADSTGSDLIMCGATGLNAVERFLTGSVSEAIVRSAKCDVLVIRRPVLHSIKL
nr:universal stress protein [Bacillus sp. 1NLA3E]